MKEHDKLGKQIRNAHDMHQRLSSVNEEKQVLIVDQIEISELLYFINFHPSNSGEIWVHEEYMESLKKGTKTVIPYQPQRSSIVDQS